MTQRVPDQLLDQLSAFLDDELAEDERELLIRRLGRDGELHEVAARYAVIGEFIREPAGPWLGTTLRQRVSAALDASPVLQPVEPVGGRRLAKWLQPLIGGGIAAAVALAAVVTLQPGDEPGDGVEALGSRVVQTNLEPPTYIVPQPPLQLQGAPARLTNYAVMHSEYSTMGRRTVLTGIIADESAESGGSDTLDGARNEQ